MAEAQIIHIMRGTRFLASYQDLADKWEVSRSTAWRIVRDALDFPLRREMRPGYFCWYEPDVDEWMENRPKVA